MSTRVLRSALAMLVASSVYACATAPVESPGPVPEAASFDELIGEVPEGAEVFTANLLPMNVPQGAVPTMGRVAFVAWGDSLRMVVDVTGVPPGGVLKPEVHGSEGMVFSTCPVALSDLNDDGIIDREEAEPYSGRPLFALARATAPVSGAWVTYEQIVSVGALEDALRERHPGVEQLGLERRAVYLQLVVPEREYSVARAEAADSAEAEPVSVACGQLRPKKI